MMRHRTRGYVLGVAAAALVIFLAFAGRILLVNDPAPAGVILVLNGGTWARIAGGLAWLRRGEASRLVIDLDPTGTDWGQSESDLARQWIAHLPAPEPQQVATCPNPGVSTLAEARLAQSCLGNARSVLIVTSQYHTRRARQVFRRVDPNRTYYVAGVSEPIYFGVEWWRHREWAKTTAAEWVKLLWWEGVDRWQRLR